MFYSYRFLKKAQKKNSTAAYIRYKSNKNLAKILTIIVIAKDFVFSPKVLLKIIFSAYKLGGDTQIARISKVTKKC